MEERRNPTDDVTLPYVGALIMFTVSEQWGLDGTFFSLSCPEIIKRDAKIHCNILQVLQESKYCSYTEEEVRSAALHDSQCEPDV